MRAERGAQLAAASEPAVHAVEREDHEHERPQHHPGRTVQCHADHENQRKPQQRDDIGGAEAMRRRVAPALAPE
jgi:hypothetical protein